MGYSNSNSFSRNFTDLLNSQQEMNNPESLPSFSPHIQISSSPIRQFSSQFSDVQDLDDNSREPRHRWTPQEDVVLISGWLNTSKDPVMSNGQKLGSFWDQIAFYYGESEAVAGKPKRGASQCKKRWKNIYETVNKGNENSKRTKLDVSGTYSSSSNTTSSVEEETEERPPGVKASKITSKKSARGEATQSDSLHKLQQAWEIREKEIAARERISKQRLLETLVGRTDLSKPELNLRKKLIDEMLG
ncbi:PREDICTED: glutathione S-transferase T3-like [Camelina sativa]|uniref:Glutathione S-transferase T3-like n=1 Tax=Camelina sativa TaxID=90675 RepID=A0ABM0SKI1_CAMSA|nr:PREDICTED: glutathione S-transferase T3-like [Camelina sativa]